jgi:hypothetical protein
LLHPVRPASTRSTRVPLVCSNPRLFKKPRTTTPSSRTYLLRPWPDAFRALLADFETGALELVDLPARWLLRAGELIARYRDVSLGLVDATVIAASEMLDEPKVATLDRRHFSVVRPDHVETLTLLP